MVYKELTIICDSEIIGIIHQCTYKDISEKPNISGFLVEMQGENKRIVATDTWKMLTIDFDGRSIFSAALEALQPGMYRIVSINKRSKTTSTVRLLQVDQKFPKYLRTMPMNRPELYRTEKIGLYRSFLVKGNGEYSEEEKHYRYEIHGNFVVDNFLLPKFLEDFIIYRHVEAIPKPDEGEKYTFVHRSYAISYLVLGLPRFKK